MNSKSALSLFLLIILSASCSTIKKEDCLRDMYHFGYSHGKTGSPKKFTDEIINTCSGEQFNPNIQNYEKGFTKGWEEFCLPNNAYRMGQNGDKYFSFCPVQRENMFREKYLLGKQYNELQDHKTDIEEKLVDLKKDAIKNPSLSSNVYKLEAYLNKIKGDIQRIEAEAKKDKFYFTNPI